MGADKSIRGKIVRIGSFYSSDNIRKCPRPARVKSPQISFVRANRSVSRRLNVRHRAKLRLPRGFHLFLTFPLDVIPAKRDEIGGGSWKMARFRGKTGLWLSSAGGGSVRSVFSDEATKLAFVAGPPWWFVRRITAGEGQYRQRYPGDVAATVRICDCLRRRIG